MKRVVLMSLVLSACSSATTDSAKSYQRWTDQWIVRLGLPNIGIWPCPYQDENIAHSRVNISAPMDECYKMQAPRRWRGTWELGPGHHSDRFCPDGIGVCSSEKRYSLDWRRSPIGQVDGSKRYEVELIGRRTEYPLGQPYVIVVDRLISIRPVEAPPQPRTDDDGEWISGCMTAESLRQHGASEADIRKFEEAEAKAAAEEAEDPGTCG